MSAAAFSPGTGEMYAIRDPSGDHAAWYVMPLAMAL
jgi:hypothetical protein